MADPSPLSSRPELTAIVVIPDTFQTVARTVAKLHNQTAVSQMEVVFVHPPQANGSIPVTALDRFHSIQTRELPTIAFASAMAEGVRAARAPIVAFTEDHSFPAPNWAERLIAAHNKPLAPHNKPIAVVGPAMRCGNPNSFVSLADFYIGYGKWADPIESGVHDFMMGHNGSYQRTLLLEYDTRLEEMLDAETILQYDLGRRGYQFWLEATTYTEHLNYEDIRFWVRYMIYYGRVFAALRAESWQSWKRALYALAFPLIPFVRFTRVRADIQRAKFPLEKRWRLYAVVLAGLVLDAVGQGLGYAFGRGTIATHQIEFEFHRERHLAHSKVAPAE